jgi:hypothetical protein
MRNGQELTYILARPSPFTKAMLKAVGGMLVLGSCAFAVLWIVHTVSSEQASEGELSLLASCVVLAIVFLVQDRGKRILLTSTELVVERGSCRQRYPWRDVRGVSVETWDEGAALNRLFGRILYGSDASIPYVKIVLARAVRFPLWGPGPGTRVRGIFVPGINTLRLYLQDPERFVEHAQQLSKLHGCLGPPPSAVP